MNDGVMIAYLPVNTEWARQPIPHMTLVYCGTIDDLAPGAYNRLAKDAISAGLMTGPLTLEVTGVDVFGDDPEKVDVIKLHETPRLRTARKMVENWNASDKPFDPHATIGPVGMANEVVIPPVLFFDRIMVGWGDQRMVFQLSR